MDFTGRKRAASLERELEAQQEHHSGELRRLRQDLAFMVSHATDEQLVRWVRESASHVAAPENAKPDWEQIHGGLLVQMMSRLEEARKAAEAAVEAQEWDIKIFRKDEKVEVIGQLDREQVPALLYRLAARYAEDELGSTVEGSLRFEVEKYLDERNELRGRLSALTEKPDGPSGE